MSTRTVEVIRVGTIDLDINYPGKQLVRLRDLSALYEGGSVKDLKELHDRLRGKRLSAINVEVWDQISGAYLGSYNTDEHGTLVLPTDKKFVEVLQWKLAGGGYSDCFNGERAAGMPGLFFYFPCNEGLRSTTIKSFPGVSGQQYTFPVESRWDWYDSGFFNRPALRADGQNSLQLFGATPVGKRSFQFLWYCNDPTSDYQIFSYSGLGLGAPNDFLLQVSDEKLEGVLGDGINAAGTTQLEAGKWYLVQINTRMYSGWGGLTPRLLFGLEMDVYLGGVSELSVGPTTVDADEAANNPLVHLGGKENDGFDEIRHLDRELYENEIADYAAFLKQGRVAGKSKGSLGSVGW